jgi:phosphonopyruvate decarboxylase/sulfopyruvate decarboxylase subunit beta|tara:strand:+ start:5230 stop:5787 length:558 start_codon:yes stop_codon:yes gene_type:complete
LIRKEAMEILIKEIGDQPIISANGYISRDLFNVMDKKSNFYMIGSMGLASSIALGVALKNLKKTIFVFDGDGNILMNLGSLVTIGSLYPKNLIHIVFDNNSHESTGGQPTNSNNVKIKDIAISSKYTVYEIKTGSEFKKIFKKIKKNAGPIMIIVKIDTLKIIGQRITHNPIKIKERFMKSLDRK